MIKRANNKKKKGFSLIELIIVLAVMAIIALIAIPNFNSVRAKSKDKADIQSMETIERTVETLAAGEIIDTPSASETYTISFTGKDFKEIKEAKASTALASDHEMVKALKDVKKPNEGDTFVFTLDKDGNVEVTTPVIVE